MKSTQGMFDLIQELRKETNHPMTRINPGQLPHIRDLYQISSRKIEFKQKLKAYLGW